MKKRAMAMGLLGLVSAGGAVQGAVVFNGATYSENFDELPTANVTPSPFSSTVGQQFSLTGFGVPGWDVAKTAGTGATAMPFNADAGGSATGGIFSYGAVGTGERALGSLASGTNIPGFGVEVVNNAAFTITDVTLTFDREQYRSSTSTTNRLLFAWNVTGPVTSADFLTNAAMMADANGDLVGLPFVPTNGAITPADVLAVSVTLTGLSIAPGQSIFLRWSDANDVGNDAGLAIDNFTFNATPAPGALVLLGLGAVVAGRRRRSALLESKK